MKKLGLICIMLIALFLAGGETVFADDSAIDDYTSITYSYPDSSSGFLYKDDMFLTNAKELSTDMAKMSVGLAAAAYKQDSINSLLEGSMKFDVLKQENYSGREYTYADNDFAAYSIAKKEIQGHHVYIVAVEGTHTPIEWISNFHVYSSAGTFSGYHNGFNVAALEIIDSLYECVATSEKENNVILFTGHSRGAAVANLAAGIVTKGSVLATPEHIFAYTFACPATTTKEDVAYDNIYNFNNKGDVIASVPLEAWGFHRFGHDYDLETGAVKTNFMQRFKSVTGEEYAGFAELTDWVDLFESIYPTRSALENDDNSYMILEIFGYFIGYRKSIKSDEAKATLKTLLQENLARDASRNWYKTMLGKLFDPEASSMEAYNQMAEQEKAELLEDINTAIADTEGMDTNTFLNYLNQSRELRERIQDELGIWVETYDDFLTARNELTAVGFADMGAILYKLKALLFESGTDVKTGVFHGHQQSTYVLWINSMYYGYYGWSGNQALEDVTLPLKVTTVGQYCFYNCPSPTSFTLPDTVKYAGKFAFGDCGNVTRISLPADMDYVGRGGYEGSPTFAGTYFTNMVYTKGNTGKMLDGGIYSGYCYTPGYYSREYLTSVTVKEGVEYIGAYAFYNCSKLKTLNLPDSLTGIGNYAFNGTSSLTLDTLPASLTTVGSYAFNGSGLSSAVAVESMGPHAFASSKIKSITILGSVEEIAASVCYDCDDLEDIVIEDGVKSAGKFAFGDCGNVTRISLPADMDYAGRGAYEGSPTFAGTYFTNMVYTKGSTGKMLDGGIYSGYCYTPGYYSREYLTSVTVKEGVEYIGAYAFYNCSKLKTLNLPDSLTGIGDYAFNGTSSLTLDTLPASLTTVGSYAFNGSGLSSAVAVESMGPHAFASSKIKSITIPGSVEEIAASVCYDCDDLEDIVIEDGVKSAGKFAFGDCGNVTRISLPADMDYAGRGAYEGSPTFAGTYFTNMVYTKGSTGKMLDGGIYSGYCYTPGYYSREYLTSVTVKEGVEYIGAYAFYNCSKLKTLNLPDSLTGIGDYAFNGTSSLTLDTLPASLTTVGSYAFNGSGLSSAVAVESMGPHAFASSKIKSITIPGSVEEIAASVCYDCDDLKDIVIEDGVKSAGKFAFGDCGNVTRISLPADMDYAGRGAYEGSPTFAGTYFTNMVYTKGSTGKMLDGGIYSGYCYTPGYYSREYLTSVTVKEGVEYIGAYAFYNCSKLKTLNLPDSLTGIGDYAFNGTSSLTLDTLPASLTTVGSYAFNGSGLSSAVAVESMGPHAFASSKIKSITIPGSVEEIAASVCYDCDDLEDIVIEDGVKSAGKFAFGDCGNVTRISLPADMDYAGRGAYEGSPTFAGTYFTNMVYTKGSTGKMLDGGIYSGYCYTPGCYSREYLTSVTVKEGVEYIGAYAFYSCSKLKTLNLPDSLTGIGNYAFNGTSSLTLDTLPASLTTVGSYAFNGSGLSSAVAVESMGPHAFASSKIKSITIPGSVEEIAASVCYDCDDLEDIVIEDGVKSAGKFAFGDCGNVTRISLPADMDYAGRGAYEGSPTFAGTYFTNMVYTRGSTGKMLDGGIYSGYCYTPGCYSREYLTSVTVKEGVEYIGAYAFYNCSKLKTLNLPDSLTEIGDYAFYGTSSLTYANIPGTVTSIAGTAFNGHGTSFKFYGSKDSYTETYAEEKGIPFLPLNYPIITPGEMTLSRGSSQQFLAVVYTAPEVSTSDVAWSVSGNKSDNTVMSADGLLTVATNDRAGNLQVGATYGILTVTVPIHLIGGDVNVDLAECDVTIPDAVYTGEAIEPDLEISFDGDPLTRDVHYTLTCANNLNVGTASVEIKACAESGYKGSRTEEFKIYPADISDFHVELEETEYRYDGTAKKPAVTVKNGDRTLEADTDYTVSYSEDTASIGQKTAVIKGTGNYTGQLEAVYEVVETDLNDCTIELVDHVVLYTGEPVTPELRVSIGEAVLKAGQDYTVEYTDNVNAGTATATLTATAGSGYTGTASFRFQIQAMTGVPAVEPTCTEPGNIAYWISEDGRYFCDAEGTTPVKEEDVILAALGHNMTQYAEIPATCTEEGLEGYFVCETCGKMFRDEEGQEEISQPAAIPAAGHQFGEWQTLEPSGCETEGSEQRICSNCGLTETRGVDASGHDFQSEFTVDVEPGCVTEGSESRHCSNCDVTVDSRVIPALGHEPASEWTIAKKATTSVDGTMYLYCTRCDEVLGTVVIPAIKSVQTDKTKTYTYNGKAPAFIVTDTAGATLDRSCYRWTGISKNVGKHTWKLTFTGAYAGSASGTYTIVPKGTAIKSLTKAAKAFTVKWNAQTAKMSTSRITGYQIRYSLKKNMSGSKIKSVKGYAKKSLTVKKLKAKKQYYVQVRTYMKVGGTTYYSSWSAKKAVKTK